MTNHEKRVELHLHTTFSAMDALIDVNELIHRAADEEWPAVAITDHCSVQAFPSAQQLAKEYGVKVIYGIEACYSDDTRKSTAGKCCHMILLVKNMVGLKNLYRLVSSASIDGHDVVHCICRSVLNRFREGLLVGSACACGELIDAILSGKPMSELEKIAAYYDYLEIQPICNNRGLIRSDSVKSDDELRNLNLKIADLAARINKPLVATGNVHFLNPKDEIARSILLSARGVEGAADPMPLYYRNTEEMLAEFSYLGADTAYSAVVTNTRAIADSIEVIDPVPQRMHLPKIAGADEEIEKKSISRAEKLYGQPLPGPVAKRLNWELSVIKRNGSGSLFSIAEMLVKRSTADGFPVSTRSTAAASFVAYLLSITEINPMVPHYVCDRCRYSKFESASAYITGFDLPDKLCPVCGKQLRKDGFNIPAETFFAEDGRKIPDIDLDFVNNYQDQAAEYLKEICGPEHILRTGVVHTISEKMAQAIVNWYTSGNGIRLCESEIERTVSKLCSVKCNNEIHPCAYVIVPTEMEAVDFSPVGKYFDEYVAHFASYDMRDCLIRLDIYGQATLTLLKELEIMTATDSRTISFDDAETLRLFQSADTAALLDFSSYTARCLLKTIKPTNISALIKISGLCHGTGTLEANAECLMNDANSTKEMISTRDDVFLYLIGAGMTRHDAYAVMETVRRGVFHVDPNANDVAAALIRRTEYEKVLRSYGVPEQYIESIKEIKYLFPKAHSAAYTLLSFRAAWYKAHYPVAFYVAMLNWIDKDGIFVSIDFEKEIDDLKDEIMHLILNDDSMWMFECESVRVQALKIVCDAREHGIQFVQWDSWENAKQQGRFSVGIGCSIHVAESRIER